MQQEISRSDRTGAPLSVILVDLDSFKAVNDTHGHQAGDSLLTWTAHTPRDVARPADAVARLGGDEFAVVLAGTDPAEAAAVIEQLHAALDHTSPASLGAATYPSEAADTDELLHLADQRVYRDKAGRAGRPAPTELPSEATSMGHRARKVSSVERRRRSIADMGHVAIANYVIGTFYLLFLAGPQTPKGALAGIFGFGLTVAAALRLAAGPIARSRAAVPILIAYAATQLPLTVVGSVLDGGLWSPVALGMLAPRPLVALTSPLRQALPVGAVMASAYVGVGLTVGAPSGWYIVVHLGGVVAIAGACAIEGRTAAVQRTLLTRMGWGRRALLTGRRPPGRSRVAPARRSGGLMEPPWTSTARTGW
jgi:diguanylate cyclase (GGDEF)-like protein